MKRTLVLLTILAFALPGLAAAAVEDAYADVDRTKGFPFKSGATINGER